MPQRADRFLTLIKATFTNNAEAIMQDMMTEAIYATTGDTDVVISQQLIDVEADRAQYRLELAADSAAWQGFQAGQLEVLETAEDEIDWELEPGADHCPTCLVYAAGSPYTAFTLPGIPAQAATECNGSCRCNLKRHAA